MAATAEKIQSEESVSSLFGPEIMLPSQFSDPAASKSIDRGEKRLMLAVLEEAVATFQRHVDAKNRHGQRVFQEADEWIRSTDSSWPFAFENICNALEINPEYLRRGLERWRDAQRHTSAGARVYRFPFRRVNGRRASISLRSTGLRESA
ncbi:MAG: hypothetical protein ACREQQ_00765 [Candidatus Binatia bacterium]